MSFAALFDVGRDWWEWDYPSRIMDQHFATHVRNEDLLPPAFTRGIWLRRRSLANIEASGESEVKYDDKEFKVALNVKHFKPEELEVKVTNNSVVIHGKHEEKSDDYGLVTREFTRKYIIPKSCEIDTVTSSLSPEGVLTIKAPKKPPEELPDFEWLVPIERFMEDAAKGSK